MDQLNFGLIGGGTVGSGVWHHWRRNGALLESRLGLRVCLSKVAVKALDEARPYPIPASVLTTDWQKVVQDRQIHAVIELVGGTTLAKTMILTALRLGKPVITANKALISAHGEELFAAARQHGANLYYEASVGGRDSDHQGAARRVCGQSDFAYLRNRQRHLQLHPLPHETGRVRTSRPTLAEAQRMGYAEADPATGRGRFGFDAQDRHSGLAGAWVLGRAGADFTSRASGPLRKTDIEFAEKLGYTIKLLGVVKVVGSGAASGSGAGKARRAGSIQVSVYPALVPNQHVLAGVNDVFNAIFVRGDVVGDTLFYGRGAGQDATASAVLSDIADAALDLKHGTKSRVPAFVPHDHGGDLLPIAQAVSRYYLRLSVVDKPGTLAKITTILAAGQNWHRLGDPAARPRRRGACR